MYIRILLSLLVPACICDPGSPRIYNVLISSKKNLAPSQALPVYEPVLRTTSVGLAFPPLIYTPFTSIQSTPSRYIHGGPVIGDIISNNQPSAIDQNYVPSGLSQIQAESSASNKTLPQNAVPLEQFIPYYNNPSGLGYEPYLPKEQGDAVINPEKAIDTTDPRQIVANLKKNPDIPDVPPPPLPVTVKS